MEDYRPVSTAAVASIVFAASSVVSLFMPIALVLTLPSLACAVVSLWRGRRRLTAGRRLAIVSIGVCGWLLINVPTALCVAYFGESPAGYARIDFAEAAQKQQLHAHVGKPVCLKGFPVINSWSGKPVSEIAFSPNGSPRDAERVIAVQLKSGTSWMPFGEPLAVSGVLVKSPTSSPDEPRYVLQNAVVRKSRTPFGIAAPAFERC